MRSAARPATAPAQVSVGISTGWLELPIGSALGGYAGRSTTFLGSGDPVDGRALRHSETMVPSMGLGDGLRADAMVIETASDRVVFIRTDLPVVMESALFDLERRAAPDGSLTGRILLAASHSHAGWAGWVPSYVLAPGMDTPRLQLYERIVDQLAAAVRAALGDLRPAHIGIAVAEGLDPGDQVHRDRRVENNELLGPDGNTAGAGKDPQSWALRVDEPNGTPRAALFSLPLHGTIGDELSQLVSTDAPGAMQRGLSRELGYPVFHLQGAAGDVSPAGSSGREHCTDRSRCLDLPRIEALGARAAELFAPLIRGVETQPRFDLEVVTHSFEVSRRTPVMRPDGTELSYPEPNLEAEPDGKIFDEQGKLIPVLDEFNAPSGAALCGGSAGSPFPINGTRGLPGYGSCYEVEKTLPAFAGLFRLPTGIQTPICDTTRTTVTAVRFTPESGDETMILSLPGEPTAPLAAYLRGRAPFGPERTLLIGYAQDYVGYLLTAEDWLSGGYEPSINVWGPLEGEMVVAGLVRAAELAATHEKEDPDPSGVRFEAFEFPDLGEVTPGVTPEAGSVPTALPELLFLPDTDQVPVSAQPGPTTERGVGAARFVWLGGDAHLDYPRVSILREESAGNFEVLRAADGTPADSREGSVVVTYTPDPIDSEEPTRHFWAATWQAVAPEQFSSARSQAPFGLPAGRYRFRVSGRAMLASGEAEYALDSDVFEVVAAGLGERGLALSAGELTITARLNPGAGLRALQAGESDGPLPLPGPWQVVATLADSSTRSTELVPSGVEASWSLPEALNVVSVEVRDAAGNGGVITPD